MSTSPKHTLFDVPVSNNGARCRLIVYKKELSEEEVKIVSPASLGGLKDPQYLALNPQGKMPLLTVQGNGMNIPESDTICRYLCFQYSNVGPSFLPDNVKSNLIARLHDMYLTTIQGCMYKASPPFGIFGSRKDALAEYQKQLQVIDDVIDDNDGIYLCGEEVSLADATLFPSIVFARHILPKFGIPEDQAIPSKIAKWFDAVKEKDDAFAKVYEELQGGLQTWESNNRWDSIWLAGLGDEEAPTIFDKIIAGEIPAFVVKEDSNLMAFKDINPAAPAHVLVIPKDRNGLSSIRKSSSEHVEILGKLLVAAGEIANDKSLGFGDGARIVINDGKDGGQEVPHLHLHVLGGRALQWPPG
eukprot:CAMPEP_0197826140 /NCGR_PEP_ID=MMETSP1437-20131217/3126_1 /TAXON_ID=49252 ORGANISM="Eucampia antarctica, Strain CCMP1452" /NCGR_SAMPLE_ID=MMETSP1437 /ASSEMBLY_ACC=CAM_ASM_001096 /LENGTH=357 /DNA_ID=CAMNT_0043426437 /DNA_START=84 /DNA_END=1157 /DNA_ORIENTATION=-